MTNAPLDIAGSFHRHKEQPSHADFCIGEVSRSVCVHHTSLTIDDSRYMYGPPHGQLLLLAEDESSDGSSDKETANAVDHLLRQLLRDDHWLRSLSKKAWAPLQENLETLLVASAKLSGDDSPTAQPQPSLATMVAFITWPHIAIVGVGKGTAFLVRNDLCTPLTERESGATTELGETNRTHTSWRGELADGDVLVVCSAHATESLNASDIAHSCQGQGSSAQDCADKLMAAHGAQHDVGIPAAAAIVAKQQENPPTVEQVTEKRVATPATTWQ